MKKVLSLLLAVMMVITIFPISALADDTVSTPEMVKINMNAASTTARLYAVSDTAKANNLLAEVTPSGTSYSVSLELGDYILEGYNAGGEFNGSIKIPVKSAKEEFNVLTIGPIKATNSGWVLDQDYSMEVTVSDQQITADRQPVVGENNGGKTVLCLYGDTVKATFTPLGEHAKTYRPATFSTTCTYNVALQGALTEGVQVNITAPKGSTVIMGTLSTYYRYSFIEPVTVETNEDGTVTAHFLPTKGQDTFFRVQNPDGVTYWKYAKYNAATDITVSADEMHIGDSSFNKDTLFRFDHNVYDRADIYLNINTEGYLDLEVGDTYQLNSFRNWFCIENFVNSEVALPDMHYEVIDVNGEPSDVVTVTPNAYNSNVADLKANKAGTAIVLITYDAMTYMNGQSSTSDKRFSAIWPECTGAFVVTVGEGENDIETNMLIKRPDSKDSAIDSEHDILFYTGDEGTAYSFTPEEGCTVEVAVPTIKNGKMTFSGFSSNGVTVSESGEVTVSGLKTGRNVIKVTKNGNSTYQVITARQVSYKILDSSGKELAENTKLKAGDTIKIQFSNLVNPAEKLSGVYNYNASLYYQGEDGTFFRSSPGGGFGVYDFSGNPVRQIIEIKIPKYWDGESYDLTGAIRMGGFGQVQVGKHRGITYAKGLNPDFHAPTITLILSRLPDISIPLEKTDFINAKFIFMDGNGRSIDRDKITITVTDSAGIKTIVAEDGTFPAVEDTYSYAIYASGYEYISGSVKVTSDDNVFVIKFKKTSDGAWDGLTKTEPQKDDDGVYLITNGAELAYFCNLIASVKTEISARLTADIDLGKYLWTGVTDSAPFTLDGDGHCIYNFNTNTGLFSGVSNAKSVIKNLTIKGDITVSKTIGVFARTMQQATIENCVNEVNVTSTATSGSGSAGIVGYASTNAKIINCVNKGNIYIPGQSSVGGIVGYCHKGLVISGCYNTGTITGKSQVAGILAQERYEATVTNCYNTGKIVGQSIAGGIVGTSAGKLTSNCYTVGQVTGGNPFAGSVNKNLVNCYYLNTLGTDSSATAMTADELKYNIFNAEAFGSVCGGGYQALLWQKDVTFHEKSGEGVVTAPTCTEKGYTTFTCSKCNESFKAEYVEATGHTPGEDLKVYPTRRTYTCSKCNVFITEWNDERLEHMTMPEEIEYAQDITMSDPGTADGWKYNSAKARFESSASGLSNKNSETAIKFTLTYGGTLTFDYGVSSEKDCDKLTISVTPEGGSEEKVVNGISGDVTGKFERKLEAGTYTVKFTYSKDARVNEGEDLAYIKNVELTAMTMSSDEWDKEMAKQVDRLIEAIGEVTKDSGEAISLARASYDALTDKQKELVTKLQTLLEAEAKYAQIVADQKAADAVIALINALPAEASLENKTLFEAARNAYDALTPTQKALVPEETLKKLTDGEAAIVALENAAAASNVDSLIEAIGEVTLEKEPEIKAARAAYDLLSEGAKALVTKYNVLTAAEEKYAELVQEAADKAAAKTVEEMIAALPEVDSLVLTDKASVVAARAAFNNLTVAQKEYVPNEAKLIAAENKIVELQAAADKQAADEAAAAGVKSKIDEIPSPLTLNDKPAVEAARAAYDALTEDQKKLVSENTLQKLIAAEAEIVRLEKERDNKAAAAVIENLISNIGTVTLESKPAIDAARAAYEGLTADQKQYVSNYDVLTEAEAEYVRLTDQAAADAVKNLIEAIGNVELTDACKAKINAARTAYDALTDTQKALVSNYNVLTNAEAEYARLESEAADKAAAQVVIDKIAAIGKVEVTEECKAKISAARTAYGMLTESQKKFVTNYNVLTEAEAEYARLSSDETIAKEVYNKIADIGNVELTDACKTRIDNARAAYNALTDAQKKLVSNYNVLTDAEAEYARLVKEDADKKAAKEVEEKIAALQPVTKDSGEAIKDARSSYEALTPEQKELVSKDSVAALEKAEKAYGMIVDSSKPDASDKGDKTTGSVIKISATGSAKGEQNPNTGAPAMSIAPAVLVLAAAVLVLKKRG